MPREKNSCTFYICSKNLLDNDYNLLSSKEKEHVQLYHRRTTYRVGLKNTIFLFRRDLSRSNLYVCVCDTLFTTRHNFKTHIFGSDRREYPQPPCQVISNKAIHVASTKEILNDNNKPINYFPVEFALTNSEMEDQQGMEQPMPIQQNTDAVDITHQQTNPQPDPTIDHRPDFHRILADNDRALADAISALNKARSDIKNLLHSK